MDYKAPAWLPGGHLQTIWPALFARHSGASVPHPVPRFARERWASPDADFIDVDRLTVPQRPLVPTASPREQTLLVMFHGLEGASRSHYAQAFAHFALEHGLGLAIPHFRGCSGELNWGPRAYHSGDFEEIGWILARLRQSHVGPMVAVGISLGGNALLRWAQEMGCAAAHVVSAVAAVSAPLDLAASGTAIGKGFNRYVYTRMFLHTMVPKALKKLDQYPGLFSRDAMLAARDLYAFDNVFTAPLHGYKDTEDYWSRASAKPHLHRLRIPSLIVNAKNDPFVPASCLPKATPTQAPVTLWQPQDGGHVGFAHGAFPSNVCAMPNAVGNWLLRHVQREGVSYG